MKRIFDLLISITSLIVLSPILILVALLVFGYDRGPVFFKQRRIGLGGVEFSMYKFRSMIIDAESKGAYYTVDKDIRITPIGKIIRRTSLDELPQLINVLIGTMSIVGPRPDLPVQEKLYSPSEWNLRCSAKPGITGLSQATLRSSATAEERKNLDLIYVANKGMFFDIKIIFLTIKQVIVKGGN